MVELVRDADAFRGWESKFEFDTPTIRAWVFR